MFFELFADTCAKERGPELGPSLTNASSLPTAARRSIFTEICSGSEEGSYSRLIDCVSLTSRLESNKEEEEGTHPA
jgi:hypothetical protein